MGGEAIGEAVGHLLNFWWWWCGWEGFGDVIILTREYGVAKGR